MNDIERQLKIYCGNKSTMLYSNNNRSSMRSKHIDIKFLIIKERAQSLQVAIEYIGTNSIIAEPFSMDSPPKIFHEHIVHMDVVSFDNMHI